MSSSNSRRALSRVLFPLFGVLVLSSPAFARGDSGDATTSVVTKHAAAMEKGLNHEEARVASAAPSGAKAASPATKHAAAMDRGLNHEDARTATYERVPDRAAWPAVTHSAAMDRGLNHEDARAPTYAP